jgi:arylsulfatase A-like enzyme
MKRIGMKLAVGTALVAVSLGAAYVLIGGQEGMGVLLARLNRTKPLPNQKVAWEQGPANASPTETGKRRPNVVVILADDLGYNDLTINGGGVAGGVVPTPNINSIATEGVNCVAAYAGCATCSPSRAALLTGRYGTRFGFEFTSVPVSFARIVGHHRGNPLHAPIYHSEREKDVPAYTSEGLPTSEVTLPNLLSGVGYHTIHLGKWHLGEDQKFSPHSRGFDESLGFLAGGSMYGRPDAPDIVGSQQSFDPVDSFIWAAAPYGVQFNDGPVFDPAQYLTDYLTDHAVTAIKANRNRPFFMYLAYNAPHTPLQATKSDYDALPQIKDHALRIYAAMIRSLDRNIGRVLQSLKDEGLDDNTLVIFASDNGGAGYLGFDDINKPLRGWKASFFEGGVRVPLFMRWPSVLPKGGTYKSPVTLLDIYATAAAAAGAKVPTDRVIDGRDLIPYLTGRETGRPHENLFWRSGPYWAVRAGDWKLQVAQTPREEWLFNLAEDPTEQHNLAGSNPAKLAELKKVLEDINAEQAKPLWPALIEAPVWIDKPLGKPVAPQDTYIYWSN